MLTLDSWIETRWRRRRSAWSMARRGMGTARVFPPPRVAPRRRAAHRLHVHHPSSLRRLRRASLRRGFSSPMDSGAKNRRDYPFSPPSVATGDGGGGGEPADDVLLFLAAPAGWLVRLLAFLGERVASAILGGVVLPVAAAPATLASLLRRAALGLLAAARTFAALLAALAVSLLLGFALVRHWVQDPVTLRHPLYFDYTEPHPSAAVALAGARRPALPAGQFVTVSMALLLPDSYHNREVGVFQIKAEAMTPNGNTIASATQPYMLRYKSPPLRLAQTTLMWVPLAMGIRSESQTATLKLLSYREGHGRHKNTGFVRVILQPRAMTLHLPQLYRAEITLQTSLPWMRELMHRFKWTMSVWVSFFVYAILLVVAAVCRVRGAAISARERRSFDHQADGKTASDLGESTTRELSGGGVFKWRERRKRRKAIHEMLHGSRVELKLPRSSTSGVAVDTDEVIDDPGRFVFAESSAAEFG